MPEPGHRLAMFAARLPLLAFRTLRAGPQRWVDVAEATFRLARANHRLRHLPLASVADLATPPAAVTPELNPAQSALIERIAWVIPRVGKSSPWRADCLIQAVAAQEWLAKAGVASSIVIGVKPEVASAFDAHAWLTVGDQTVIGGDASAFSTFTQG